MEVARLKTLAARAVKKLRGRLPDGVTPGDAINDAIVVILRWEPTDPPEGVNQDAFLVMKAWGTLKDNYGREWKKTFQTPSDTNFPPVKREADSAGDENDAAVPINPVYPKRPVANGVCEDDIEAHQTRIDLHEALDKLDPRSQRIMRAILEGRTHQEIADAEGLSQPWVSRLVRQAQETLKTLLGAYE